MKGIAIATIAICFVYAFINGFHDGCNVIATIIASRSISPKVALRIASVAEFIGPMLLGTSVAATIGKGVVDYRFFHIDASMTSILLFLSAISGAILWNLFTWWAGMPSSSTHALIGGLLGAGAASYGTGCIRWDIFLNKVLLVQFTSPLIGFVAGYVFFKLVSLAVKDMHPRINKYLKKIQLLSMFLLAISHGSNDAQKSMGIVATILFLVRLTPRFAVTWQVQAACALAIALGVSAGGWKLVKTVGVRIFNVKPIHSFSSQMASALVMVAASITGGPVSINQVVNTSIMGVGTAERKNAVRWDTVKNILLSWLFTIPASALMAAVIYFIAVGIRNL